MSKLDLIFRSIVVDKQWWMYSEYESLSVKNNGAEETFIVPKTGSKIKKPYSPFDRFPEILEEFLTLGQKIISKVNCNEPHFIFYKADMQITSEIQSDILKLVKNYGLLGIGLEERIFYHTIGLTQGKASSEAAFNSSVLENFYPRCNLKEDDSVPDKQEYGESISLWIYFLSEISRFYKYWDEFSNNSFDPKDMMKPLFINDVGKKITWEEYFLSNLTVTADLGLIKQNPKEPWKLGFKCSSLYSMLKFMCLLNIIDKQPNILYCSQCAKLFKKVRDLKKTICPECRADNRNNNSTQNIQKIKELVESNYTLEEVIALFKKEGRTMEPDTIVKHYNKFSKNEADS